MLWAQTNEELFREYQFNFSLPGARANAMGGAFIGLADDATSSFANPAGLAFLRDAAISLEYRDRTIDTRTGSISGPTNFAFEQLQQEIQEISFLSFNARWHEWYFGVFYYRFLNERQQRDFVSRTLIDGIETVSAINVDLGLTGTNQGIGIARRVRNFKFGLSINQATLDVATSFTKEQVQIHPEFLEKFTTSRIDERDHQLAYTLGLQHGPSEWFSWGLVARINPNFNLLEHVEDVSSGQTIRVADFDIPFVVPDVYGAGIRVKPRNDLSVLLDWQYVRYQQIIKNGFTIVESPESDRSAFYTVDDIQEFHLGAEWLIPQGNHVWAVRGGYYRNPTHFVEYIGQDPVQSALFSRRESPDENHVTMGLGWGFKNQFNLDLSANFWGGGQEFTASIIWRKK
ncbi:MAG: hypothetical protein H6510_04395 [Acidobacteria bacterium]|nr:hypothetical protein [Acidobacteriota bacterium]MCB9397037.1 hypothetical protein [Acidobacteriota bacterium]